VPEETRNHHTGTASIRNPQSAIRNSPTLLVLYTPARSGQFAVVACSADAAHYGIRPGMALAEAKALAAGIDVEYVLHDSKADRQSLERLAEMCLNFSPWVAIEDVDEPASLFLDISGTIWGFDSEEELAQCVADYFPRLGYHVQIAVADTIGAAWALAHAEKSEAGSRKSEVRSETVRRAESSRPAVGVLRTTVCNSSQSAIRNPQSAIHNLHSLDVTALRLPEATVRLLYQFDIRRIGQLLALPRESLPSRFGPEVQLRLDQALGRTPEILTPIQPSEPVEACSPFDPPISDRRWIEASLEELLSRILNQLKPRQLGVQRLHCTLCQTVGSPISIAIGLLQPSASDSHLRELLHLHLERVQTNAEISEIVLHAEVVRPLEFHQEQLYRDPGAERSRYFPALIERLSNRLGNVAVLRPRLLADAQPEHAFHCSPWVVEEKLDSNTAPPVLLPRPVCLHKKPVAIAVMSIVPEGPPLRFEWEERDHVVCHYWGPERIETGWWRGEDIQRDYYWVETTMGRRFWIFRRRQDETWFLHG